MTNTGNAGHEAVRTRALDDLRRFDVVMEGLGTVHRRSLRSPGDARRAQRGAHRIQGDAQLRGGDLSDVRGKRADYDVLTNAPFAVNPIREHA